MKTGHVLDYHPETESLVNRLTAAGFSIVGATNGEDSIKPELFTTDRNTFFAELLACDEFTLYVQSPEGKRLALYCVLGNEPGVLVANYSIHAALDALTEAHFEEWSAKEQPTKFCQFTFDRHTFNAAARASARLGQ